MTTTQPHTNITEPYLNWILTALGLAVAAIALGQWANHLLLINTPESMATAFTWTVVSVAAFTPLILLEHIQNRGD